MGHKTIVGGTQYNVKKGKALVGGTEYSVKKGKTLVDGTVYEVGFVKPVVTIMLRGDFSYSGVRYNGVYYSSPTTFTANVGDEIFVESYGYTDSPIYLNGTLVANEPSETEYYYTVVSDTVIDAYAWGESYTCSSRVNITEVGDDDAILSITTNAIGAVTDSCAIITVKGYGTYSAATNATYDLIVPIGTEIEFTVKSSSASESVIGINRVNIASATKDSGPVSYTYIVNSNATIVARSMMNVLGSIMVTDASLNPESTMTVTRQGSKSFVDGEYLEYNAPSGTSESRLYAGQYTVPTGTYVNCWISSSASATSQIIVNGIVVKSGTGSYEEYDFQVSGNVTIDIRNYDTYGVITITK